MANITLNDIAGLATEKMAWLLLQSLATGWECQRLADITPRDIIVAGENYTIQRDTPTVQDIKAYRPPERSTSPDAPSSEAAEIWTLGLLAFYALMGTDIFEHQGGAAQDPETLIPRIGLAHCSQELSDLIYSCLNHDPSKRPTMQQIQAAASIALQQTARLSKRLTDDTGKSYQTSLVNFWPEEMVVIAMLFIMSLLPIKALALSTPAIPTEMQALVDRCIALRQSSNVSRVTRELQRDSQWTLMDEIEIDRNGECSIKDPVNTFGLNDIGFRIFKLHSGVVNQGGRFRDGRDPRYSYSFIEITIKKSSKVTYDINGREGSQLLAIVPHDSNARFTASVSLNGKRCGTAAMRDGVCYLSIEQKLRPSDHVKLTIVNQSGHNMAFALINYNSRK